MRKGSHGLINNYHIHICEVRKFENTEVFRTDLKQVFDFIRLSKDPEKLYELVRKDPAYQKLDEDAYDVIAEYVNDMKFKEIKKENLEGGTVNMDSVAEGLIQLGRRQGIEQGIEQGVQALIEMSMKFGSTKQETMEYIMEKMQISRENAEKYMEEYWH